MLKKILHKLKCSTPAHIVDPAINTSCEEFEVNNWIVSDFIAKKIIPIVGTQPYPICELNLMVTAVCRLKPEQIYEWGTNIGKSARIFCETTRHFGLALELHSIDLPDEIEHCEHPQNKRGVMVRGFNEVTLHYGDGLDKTLEIHASKKKVEPEIAPLVFIDGDHDYKSVRRELDGIIENIPLANILLHDTFFQSNASGYNIGPHQAITEVLSNDPNRFKVISTTTGLPGMTLLYQQ